MANNSHEVLNCITCGVDINRCADKDLDNIQCGFCSSKKPMTEIIIENKTYEIKSTLPLQFLLSIIGTMVVSLAVWQSGVEHLPIWVMVSFISQIVIWNFLMGSTILKEKIDSKQQEESKVE